MSRRSNKSAPDPEKQLMIKVNACKRLLKEADYYKRETKENEEKLQMMKDDGKDPYDIKKFEEVLGESCMMIPDSERRLKESVEDLSIFVDTTNLEQESGYLEQARDLIKQTTLGGVVQETQVEDDAETF
eukprot:CAMPEP_0119011766 /NCGR_PEP_ID=MMETSP1176-20130426/5878_1 /TAXON_ID=265551 /ORGANISM="Synedropsis recta cf, Strain CCMP1620" /LENGTH=129 /DNA_ID=CAMNT_0006964629 /DNA_START=78 /DNA_END=467 /DNA_ORIENTATION=+